MLATPLNSLILRALADGPRQQSELRQETGSPSQTTLRAQLKKLIESGVVEKHRRNRFPGILEYKLTPAGRDLLPVIEVLQRWLANAPEKPLALGTQPAKAATKALAEGWSTTILRALAVRPQSLTELDRAIDSLSYPSLERRLAALRLVGQVMALASNGRGRPYAVTRWTREAVGPIVAAVRWERRHTPRRTRPLGRVEAETVFLLSAVLPGFEQCVSGTCRLAMEVPGDGDRRLVGAVVEIQGGRVKSCTSRLTGTADAWALGSASAWLEALVLRDMDAIERGGDGQLVRVVLGAMHQALFGPGIDART